MNFVLQENVCLAPLTTFKIGGEARLFIKAETESQVVEAFRFADENEFKVFVLGGGSNVLISDNGFDGLVLQISLKGISSEMGKNGTILVTAQAGEDWDNFVGYCVNQNLAGLECLSGIPGWVGGTPVQNVGAYGQEVSETIVGVRVFDRKSGEILELGNADCRFSYRQSIFNTTEKNRFVVLAVNFALKKDGKAKIVYQDLRRVFGDAEPTLQETRNAVLRIRRTKSMVVDENDPNSKSAGSFFKNPVVNWEKFAQISAISASVGVANVPYFAVDETTVKIPAAWLVENAGFAKGYSKNGAGISSRHTLALINRGTATAREILALKDEIQTKVKEKFGVELTPEPIFINL